MSLRVLVVDDDRSVRVGLVRMLRARGYQAVGAANGQEALEQALALLPDIIVMDLMMPVQSGTEVARALRRNPSLATVPIIALSASPRLVDADSLFKSVLTKPCRLDDLVDAITQAVEPRSSSS